MENDKRVQSLVQYAEILGVQIEDLSDVVDTIVEEKIDSINSSLENQLAFLLWESGDDDSSIRFILKSLVEE